MEKILEVNGISKQYKKSFSPRTGGDGKRFLSRWKNIFQTKPAEINDFTNAVDDVTFTLNKGDILGVIGKNGSGKSTLLKILSGVVKPASGTAAYKGKLVSILDIGTCFHPDLSGKQ